MVLAPFPTPALSQRERGPTAVSGVIQRPERPSRLQIQIKHFQVGVNLKYPQISPLSLRERVRVRGFSL
jgi:hypothetical protein